MRSKAFIVSVVAGLISASIPVSAGFAGTPQPVPAPVTSATDVVAPRPAMAGLATGVVSPACATKTQGMYTCLTIAPTQGKAASPGRGTQASIPFPTWCVGGMRGLRTQACESFAVTLTTYRVINGVLTPTGALNMNTFNFSYSAVDISTWAHQLGFAAFSGTGPALQASVSGVARSSGSCTRRSSSFPSQALSPFLTIRDGEAFFDTTATAIDAVGTCTTTWDLTFTVPQHLPATMSVSMSEIRCDNATGANGFRPRRVGCVVPWYASAVTYSSSQNPTLASHVSRAQGSGLPGNSFGAPLFRTTNQSIIDTNRNLACGDAPSIAGLSCDEYPLASTYNGLAFGGSRRTFSDCNINAPAGTGSSGASACMINQAENNSQGGQHAAFYYDWRILDADPFLVLIGP